MSQVKPSRTKSKVAIVGYAGEEKAQKVSQAMRYYLENTKAKGKVADLKRVYPSKLWNKYTYHYL